MLTVMLLLLQVICSVETNTISLDQNENQPQVESNNQNQANLDLTVTTKTQEYSGEVYTPGNNDPTWDHPPDWFPSGIDDDGTQKEANKNEEVKTNREKENNSDETPNKQANEMGFDPEVDYSHYSQEEIDKKMKEEEEEFARKVIEEMGINKMQEVTKETFREYLTKIILSSTHEEGEDPSEVEEDPEEEEFLNMLIEEIMKEIPDKFPIEDFKKYSDTDRYKSIVDRVLKEKFGENYGEDMMKMMSGAFESGKEGMPNMEDLETMMKEFNKAQGKEGGGEENEDLGFSGDKEEKEEDQDMDPEERERKEKELIDKIQEIKNANKKNNNEAGEDSNDSLKDWEELKNLDPEKDLQKIKSIINKIGDEKEKNKSGDNSNSKEEELNSNLHDDRDL